jgi:hypothetical protein
LQYRLGIADAGQNGFGEPFGMGGVNAQRR